MVKFKIKDICNTAEGVKNNIERPDLNSIPETVNVAGTDYLVSQFLDVMIRATLQLDPNQKVINLNDIENRPVNLPATSIESVTSGKIYLKEYVDIADRVYGFTNQSMVLPSYANTSLGKLSWQNLIYMYARILTWYKNNNVMPTNATVTPWTRKPAIGSGSTPTIPDELKPYLQATANCQVNDSKVQSIAKGLSGAQAIFNYILGLTYDYYFNTKRGAVKTLTDGVGNCTDLSHALIALARAKGIPARYVHNSSVKFTSITTGHVWAELYVNGGWLRADASNNNNILGINPRDSQLQGTTKRYIELPF